MDRISSLVDANDRDNDEQVLRLDDQLCFALYAASRAITNTYRPALDELKLTYPQYLVMLVLWEEGELTVGEIGMRLHLDSGTLTPLLKRLQVRGLIVRERGKDDERQVSIRLTRSGRGMRSKATAVAESLKCKLNMPARSIIALRRDIRKILSQLTADGA